MANIAARRTFSSSSTTSTTFLTKNKAASAPGAFKNAWLSDPSTYPIIFIMGCAITMVVGVSASCLAYNPDVQISPNNRGNIMRQK
eukprot:CAMPEP_0113451396 /NCGR_PEP_ID=MMETSP0014_2-20120614/6317_1 /TAXON_ID=2857 /ORGANISM="Nitzschia sp." /LENGTH=85 /DNA_ID=CAMNT_0000342751 /DNA_START=172 /DNA_END=429 /DNA_ORIENTATION=+ /assembly_acc=CAM_ASM_000159